VRLEESEVIGLAAALVASAPAGPAIVLPDGTYRYRITVRGSVSSSTVVVRHESGLIVIEESASMAGVPIVTQRRIDSSTFATLSYTIDTGAAHAVVTIAGNEATVTQGNFRETVRAAAGAPFIVTENLLAAWAQLPATLHAAGTKKVTFACPCGEFVAIPLTVVSDRAGVLRVHGSDGVDATLWYDPRTFVVQRFDVPAQKSVVVLESANPHVSRFHFVAPTPLPLPAANYASRDVAIRADDGVTLAGTLTTPNAAATPMPGFVLVHGSGCIDRDETIGPNKVFAQLANWLSNDGYAVLRYDKRSCGKSGGEFAQRDRLIADARDAIAFLRAQPGIDPKRIFVLGHSEGGELAPSIAIADGRLRGIVLLAPPAIPLEQILMQQTLRNATPSNRAQVEAKEKTQLANIAAGKVANPTAAWLRSSFGIDPADLIANVPCPILILQGTKDFQVLAADTPRLVNAARAANRNVTVAMLPNDDHLFLKLEPDKSSTGAEYFAPSYLDPALFAAIESWLRLLAHQT
jgi:dienelactone hydrolase